MALIDILMNNSIEIKLSTEKSEGVNDAPYQDTTDCKITVTKKDIENSKIVGLDFVQTDEALIKHIKELIK